MAARPYDADEPEAVEPEAVEPGASGASGEDSDEAQEARRPDERPQQDEPKRPDDADGGDEGAHGMSDPVQGASEGAEDDLDARWLEIVAELEGLEDSGDAGADDAEDDASENPPARPSGSTGFDGARILRPATPETPRSWTPAVDDAEDHFEPPDPGPVLGGDPLLTMAWTAVAGVPALLVIAVVAWRDIPTAVLEAAGVAFLGAVGLLLWRMPHRRDDDSGPGAVV